MLLQFVNANEETLHALFVQIQSDNVRKVYWVAVRKMSPKNPCNIRMIEQIYVCVTSYSFFFSYVLNKFKRDKLIANYININLKENEFKIKQEIIKCRQEIIRCVLLNMKPE